MIEPGVKLHILDAFDNLDSWQSVAEIADHVGYSVAYVNRLLGELREEGKVVSRRDPNRTGRGNAPKQWRLAQ